MAERAPIMAAKTAATITAAVATTATTGTKTKTKTKTATVKVGQLTASSSEPPSPLQDNGGFIKDARLALEHAWLQLDHALQALPSSTAKEHLVAHMAVARHWKSWGDLKQMQKTVLLMGNIARQDTVGSTIDECLDDIRETVQNVLTWLEQTDWM